MPMKTHPQPELECRKTKNDSFFESRGGFLVAPTLAIRKARQAAGWQIAITADTPFPETVRLRYDLAATPVHGPKVHLILEVGAHQESSAVALRLLETGRHRTLQSGDNKYEAFHHQS